MSKLHNKKIKEAHFRHEQDNLSSSFNRARSITVGTCFGGTTEVMMRANDGTVLWAPMQPVEVMELIHQLAANIGCHINVKPRDDFASWRGWRAPDTNNQLPLEQQIDNFQKLGVNTKNNSKIEHRKKPHAETMAAKKNID